MAVEDGGKAEKPQEGERRRNLQVVVVKRIIQLGKGDYIYTPLIRESAYLHLIDNDHLGRQLESQIDGEEDHPDSGAEGEASDNSESQHQTSATKTPPEK